MNSFIKYAGGKQMKQTIEIEVPDGYKAVYNKDTQKIEIVKVELPKTWEEFCENYHVKSDEYLIDSWGNFTIPSETERYITRFLAPNKETAEAFIVLMQLIQLRDCYRQGWVPDWTRGYDKYCVLCVNGVVSIDVRNYASSVLSFQYKEIRDEFLKNFRGLIEIAKDLI